MLNINICTVQKVLLRLMGVAGFMVGIVNGSFLFAYAEQGNPFIWNYTPADYKAHFQNWVVAQDSRGVMYFGNGNGVLEYDGRDWRTIPVSNNSLIRSLAVNVGGVIYVGAVGEFGLLAPDKWGALSYASLSGQLKENEKNFGDVWSINITSRAVYFKTSNRIFRLSRGRIEVVPVQSTPFSFALNDAIFFHNDGVYMLKENSPRNPLPPLRLPHTQVLSREHTGLLFVLPFKKDKILAATQDMGFYIYDLAKLSVSPNDPPASILKRFPTEVDEYIRVNRLYGCKKLSGGLYALATLKGGIALMDEQGNLVQVINKNRGLHMNMVMDVFEDRQQNLWAALNNGLSYIVLNSPTTRFNQLNGLEEPVQAITRYKGTLYVGATCGLYYLQDYRLQSRDDRLCFLPVKNISEGCWDFITAGDALLVANNNGVFRIDNLANIKACARGLVYCLGRSPRFPDYIFFGGGQGLGAIEMKSGINFLAKGKFREVKPIIRRIVSDRHGNLWLTSQYGGIIYLRFKGDDITDFDIYIFETNQGLPQMNWNYVYYFNHQIIVGTKKGIYKADIPVDPVFDPRSLEFVPENTFGKMFNTQATLVDQIFFDKTGKTWISSGLGFFVFSRDQGATGGWLGKPVKGLEGEDIMNLWVEENGPAWVCTPNGLFCYDPRIKTNRSPLYQTLIRRVTLHSGPVLFNGYPGDSGSRFPAPRLAYRDNSLTIDYAAPYFSGGTETRFSYILEGFDRQWRGWNAEGRAVYTNLPEGDYCFKVMAKNDFDRESSTAMYRFSISPPWWRSTLAYTSYGLALLTLILGVLQLHHYRVKQAVLLERQKYQKTPLDDAECKKILKKLLQTMEQARPYLDASLTMQKLSRQLAVAAHHLSMVINKELNQNFYDFVNNYRIEDARRILSDPRSNETEIMNIASKVGFNSISAFYRAFKKQTGLTPFQFRKKALSAATPFRA